MDARTEQRWILVLCTVIGAALVGGLLWSVTDDIPMLVLGVVIGSVIGGVLGRSRLMRNVLTEICTWFSLLP